MEKFHKTHYSIADMAKQLGMTTEGVRFYEKQGIVCFRRAPETGRSVFRSRCATVMRFIRTYNTLGIPLAETQSLLAAKDGELSLSARKLDDLRAKQQHKIWRESRILDRINEQAAFLRMVDENMIVRSFGFMPNLRILRYGDGQMLRSDKILSALTSAWQKLNPISFPVVICPSDQMDLSYNDCPMGLAFEEQDYAAVLDDLPSACPEAVEKLGGSSCLHLHVVEEGDDSVSIADLLKDELAYLERRGMRICGDIVLRPIVVNNQAKGYKIHHLAWLPVEDCD